MSGLHRSEAKDPGVRQVVGVGILVLLLPGVGGVAWPYLEAAPPEVFSSPVSHFPAAEWPGGKRTLGSAPRFRPRITQVRIVDLDQDGRKDIPVSDGQHKRVHWYRQTG